MLEFEYARAALKNGLALEAKLGANPYKFGVIGSTDAHTGLAAVEEENFFGKTSVAEPSPERLHATFMTNPKINVTIKDWEISSSGYAAVWATENTRAAIFDAMERRETYATTGPRMIVRFFGGWDFEPADAHNRMPAAIGYAKGVPMGGDLASAPAGKAPTFLAAVLKDTIGANLDRIQIVKGWVDKDGTDAGAHLRRRRLRRAEDRRGRPLQDAGRQHGRRGERDLDQHHRRAGADHGLEGPGRSTRRCGRSTTRACSRSRRRAGPPTTRSASASSPSRARR